MKDERSVELGAINQLGVAAHEIRRLQGQMRFELRDQPLASLAAESAFRQALEQVDMQVRHLLAEMGASK